MGGRRRTVSPRRETAAARSIWAEALAIVIMSMAVLLVLSLVSYRPEDPVPWPIGARTGEPVSNVAGPLGAFLAELLRQLLGYAAWSVPPLLVLFGWRIFWGRRGRTLPHLIGYSLLLISSATCLHLLLYTGGSETRNRAGGWLGSLSGDLVMGPLNRWGGLVVAMALLGTSLLLITRTSFLQAIRTVSDSSASILRGLWLAVVRHREARRKQRLRLEIARKQRERQTRAATIIATREVSPVEPHGHAPIPVATDDGSRPLPGIAPVRGPNDPPQAEPRATGHGAQRSRGPLRRPAEPATATPEQQPQFDFIEQLVEYTPPPLSLLAPPQEHVQVNEKELVEIARMITEKCREFGVNGQVIAIQPGPVVTVFEFKPDAGVKYSRIVSLADDLCLAIEAESIRIDRLAGKATVGIEVPNRVRETIALRELLSSERFSDSPAPLTIALGKEINGEPYYARLDKMPHLLIAGSTGSGKSVCLNSVITSILYKASPDQVKFIMIDPKRLELGLYENIPHLLTPLVVDTKKAANALRWATMEMEKRYKHLAEAGVRSIEQYNISVSRRARGRGAAGEGASTLPVVPEAGPPLPRARGAPPDRAAEPPQTLPYIVILIDELSDLMMTTGAEVEESITRLAQMARAVGIHLILSTQRPSVDVITGVIKANFPCRIAMRVSSKVDSRTILDSNGAEQLLGHGDMLFIPPGSARLVRLHGPFVSEVEASRITAFLKKQARPQYNESVTREEPQGGTGSPAGRSVDVDAVYDQAVRMAVQMGQISVSHLQRRLKLGYARAARLVDTMEENGIVGPADGSKPREVLVEPDFLERLNQMREEGA
ncbi:MAG: DNA translocase FtsK 4TM domain-containing protein [Acidobacteria bacterium]|nr:DNA translocase FtsK 4TM domain-containing protein [Acidobacteriota bacterium]